MPNAQDVLWFKREFQAAIDPALAGTPFSVDMLAAVACQETGGIWPLLRRKGLPTARILELCVGDTIDASPTGGGRRAFPKNKAELLGAPGGAAMFALARQGLVDMAQHIPGYSGVAARPDKFCHGFGIFQLDLQFFKTEPEYFLQRRYADFGAALAKCIGELKAASRRIGWGAKTSLTDLEMAGVAIAYNTGRYDPARGLKQGYFDGSKFYGENFFAYLQLAKSAPLPAPEPQALTRGARAMPGEGVTESIEDMMVETALRKAPTKKVPTKKVPTKKAPTKKASTKKVPTKRAPAKKATARKAPVRKTLAKKAVAKKAAAKKAPARKAR